jgi:hypothetical protein
MEPEGSLKRTAGAYPEPDASTPHIPTLVP